LSDKTQCREGLRTATKLLTSHFSLLTSHFSLLTSHFSLLTSHFPLLTSHFSLLTSHFSLPTSHFPLLTSHFSLPHGAPVLLSTFYPLLSRAACDTLGAAPSAAAPHRVNLVDTVGSPRPSRAPERAGGSPRLRFWHPGAPLCTRQRQRAARALYPRASALRLIALPPCGSSRSPSRLSVRTPSPPPALTNLYKSH
ncbi:MAG: hypothetical protein RLZZ436_3295, partial [Planctomycetota bacterium]